MARFTSSIRLLGLLRVLCLTLLLTTPHVALAQSNTTVAEALFSEGRRLLDAGKYDEACAKFAESQRLDPGTGTLLNLANCYTLAGRSATAWATWKEAASAARDAGQADREQLARSKAEELEGKLARLTIDVPEGSRVPGLTIKRDGEELPSAIWGAPLPVDARTHAIEASAPGYEPFTTQVTIADAETQSLSIPELVKLPEVAPEPEPTQATPAATAPVDSGKKNGSTQRIVGYVVGGVGLVGLGLGTYFGIDAINKNSDARENECDPSNQDSCTTAGQNQINDARTSGTISSVMIGVGAAAVVGGVVLVLTAPKANTTIAAVPRYDGAALMISGRF